MATNENLLDVGIEQMKMGITYTTKNMVRYYKSDSPVIILSGHGGTKKPVNVNARTCRGVHKSCKCETNADLHTIEIAERVVNMLSTVPTPIIPSVVIADFHRKYIDVNRSQECAYEGPDGDIYYSTFHKKMREFTDNIKHRYPAAFLFDMHGTVGRGTDIYDVYVGTRNGDADPSNSSIKNLLAIDPNVLSKLRRLFKSKGYIVQPSQSGDKETFRGGYILKTYGSNNSNGIDCIQFEIDDKIRNDSVKRNKFADDLASIIDTFTHLFLPGTG